MKINKTLRKVVKEVEVMLSEKGTAIIYTDGSVKDVSNGEYRNGQGMVIIYRKKKKFGLKFVAECEYKKKKDDIATVEYKALEKGLAEALLTWEFKKVFIVSDSVSALDKLTKKLKEYNNIQFDLELFWVKGHKKILLNEVADFLATGKIIEDLACIEEALVIPDGQPFASFDSNTNDVSGINRAYFLGEERQKAFTKMIRLKPSQVDRDKPLTEWLVPERMFLLGQDMKTQEWSSPK